MLIVFWPIFEMDTKINYRYNFVAPLNYMLCRNLQRRNASVNVMAYQLSRNLDKIYCIWIKILIQHLNVSVIVHKCDCDIKPLSAKPTKLSSKLKEFLGNKRQIVFMTNCFYGVGT